MILNLEEACLTGADFYTTTAVCTSTENEKKAHVFQIKQETFKKIVAS